MCAHDNTAEGARCFSRGASLRGRHYSGSVRQGGKLHGLGTCAEFKCQGQSAYVGYLGEHCPLQCPLHCPQQCQGQVPMWDICVSTALCTALCSVRGKCLCGIFG
eukprot:1156960-Pelagomonas_calceolata.AAC.9